MNTSSTLRVFALAVIAAARVVSAADGHCTVASLNGSYAFNAQGSTVAGSPVPAPLQGPFASAGTAAYDGRGNVTLSATAVFNGLSQPLGPAVGTYQVADDCTFTSRLANGATFYGVILAGGNQLYVLQTNTGVVASGVANNQAPYFLENPGAGLGCLASLTNGAYAFIANGVARPPTVPAPAAGPFAGVGVVRFDARGAVQLTAVRSSNGIVDPQPVPLSGRWTATSDCAIKLTFDAGFHFDAVLSNGGAEGTLTETDPGVTIVANLKKI